MALIIFRSRKAVEATLDPQGIKERILTLEAVEDRARQKRFHVRDSTELRNAYDKLVSQGMADSEDQQLCDSLRELHRLRLDANGLLPPRSCSKRPDPISTPDPIKVGVSSVR